MRGGVEVIMRGDEEVIMRGDYEVITRGDYEGIMGGAYLAIGGARGEGRRRPRRPREVAHLHVEVKREQRR